MFSCLFYTLVNSCLLSLVCSSVSVGMNAFLPISSAGFWWCWIRTGNCERVQHRRVSIWRNEPVLCIPDSFNKVYQMQKPVEGRVGQSRGKDCGISWSQPQNACTNLAVSRTFSGLVLELVWTLWTLWNCLTCMNSCILLLWSSLIDGRFFHFQCPQRPLLLL